MQHLCVLTADDEGDWVTWGSTQCVASMATERPDIIPADILNDEGVVAIFQQNAHPLRDL